MAGPSLTVPAGLTLAETRRLSSKFSIRMAQSKDDMNFYWRADRRDIIGRSSFNPCGAVPDDAVLIGCYRPPYPSVLFLADLSATIQVDSVRQGTSGSPVSPPSGGAFYK